MISKKHMGIMGENIDQGSAEQCRAVIEGQWSTEEHIVL